MGFLGDLGAPNIGGGGNLAGTGQALIIVLSVIIVLVIAGVITFRYYLNKKQKIDFKYRIHIFKEVNGEPQPIDDDSAMEVYVQDSNVSLFYLKKRKLYIAKPTKAMGKSAFWYNILPNGEWVNFSLKGSGDGAAFSEADYDHRDTRYAYINLKEIIKRNYKDKAVQWWKEYSPLITFVIVSFIFILGCWILLAKLGKTAAMLGPIAENMKIAAEGMKTAATTCSNSGFVGG